MLTVSLAERALYAFVFVSIVSHFVYARWIRRWSRVHHPPGPSPLPLLGNVYQLPDGHKERTMSDWAVVFGKLVYVSFFRTRVLIVSSLDVAQEIMEKRSMHYSDRPRLVHMQEMMQWTSHLGYAASGEDFRKHRKWLQSAFLAHNSLVKYRPIQLREVRVLLDGMSGSSSQFEQHLNRFIGAILMEVVYGYTVTSADDKFLKYGSEVMEEVAHAGYPSLSPPDWLPFLKYVPTWLPFGKYRKESERFKDLVRKMRAGPYDYVRKTMAAGTAPSSFTSTLVEEAVRTNLLTLQEEEDIKVMATLVYGGAHSLRTFSTLSAFVLAMVLNPRVLKKAQEEMDYVVNQDRLPDFSDRNSLPYLECIIKEVYRWHVVAPLGVPHQSTIDDKVRGYDIPGKTVIIPNLWAISRDPERYPGPETFYPERFEHARAGWISQTDPRKFIFGFGRRICPGRLLADANIWLAIANMVATLDIGKARDSAGSEIEPRVESTSGFISHFEDYMSDMKPRSENAAQLIAAAAV
ncbi:hypothetical protein IEO21_06771 [Rhodonia placenta]|uniref:Cytochrome P450 n=1 Tax=Rhodonia placenta TaxID=104341 RepID=A0A8H7NZB5_9APHY|nr:hypothetical protein IEO21_06771 [Postia placenta]